jgi:GT2 family glycosyltransferase
MATRIDTAAMSRLGIVVIGRNEGERLRTALASAPPHYPLIYVDSGSNDGSLALAEGIATKAIALDPTRPFSAARARNEGAAALVEIAPDVAYIQFLDGDCGLDPGWIPAALAEMERAPDHAIVIGQLRERHPEASAYNRLCAIEWASPPGEIVNFGALGGIMLIRRAAFDHVGGFNDQVIAGEDSELGVRIGLAGYRVVKIEAPMAVHDAEMTRLSQWWTRAVRAGHAIGQRHALGGHTPARDCVREFRSTLFWGLAVPAASILLALPTQGASLLLLGGFGLLGSRIYRHRRRLGSDRREAWLVTRFALLAKFANAVGLLRFLIANARKQFKIIEYK